MVTQNWEPDEDTKASLWRVNQERHVVRSLCLDFETAWFFRNARRQAFVMQGDKEKMVTKMIEKPAVIPALLPSWLPFLPCLLALRKLVSLRYERIKQFQSPSTMNARHGVPGLPAINSPLYPRLVLSSVLPRLTFEVINKNDTMRVINNIHLSSMQQITKLCRKEALWLYAIICSKSIQSRTLSSLLLLTPGISDDHCVFLYSLRLPLY